MKIEKENKVITLISENGLVIFKGNKYIGTSITLAKDDRIENYKEAEIENANNYITQAEDIIDNEVI